MAVIFRYKNGRIIPIKVDEEQTTNDYMNDKIRHIAVFKGNKKFKDYINEGYRLYFGNEVEPTGSNYEQVANNLIKQGYKVKVMQGKNNTYTILQKK